MNNIVNYIASHSEIRKICFFSDRNNLEIIGDIVCFTQVEKVFLLAKDTNEKKDDCITKNEKIIKINDISQINDGIDAAVFYYPDIEEEIDFLKNVNPLYLIGECEKDKINAFRVWESFRKVSAHIYIQSSKTYYRDEILNWDMRENNDVELSVIFPMYKIESYLPKCIKSVTAWDADYIEFLFVDDGSPDSSAEIVEKAAKTDSRIKLLRKENGGCASARQFGLDRAKGRYVGFIDPDDFIDESMFRKLFSRAMTGSYEISYSGFKELYEETGEIYDVPDILGWPYCDGTTCRESINDLISYRKIGIWRGIYLKDLIDRNNIHFYTDLRRFDDLPFKVETLACANSVVSVPEYLYYYRMSRPGQDVSADDERLYVHFDCFEHLSKFIDKTNDCRQKYCLQYVRLMTHIWALTKLKSEYIRPYCKMAKKDMLSEFSYKECKAIYKEMATKRSRLLFFAICHSNKALIKILNAPQKHKTEKAIKRIEKIKSYN